MSDGGLIEGSAPGGGTGAEYTTVLPADGEGSALVDSESTVDQSGDGAVYGTTYDAGFDADGGTYPLVEDSGAAEVAAPTASSEIVFGDTASYAESGGERAGCTAGSCPHPTAHPAEAEWEQLVSAVPVEGQQGRFKPRCEGMSYPTETDFRSAVAAVRPLEPDLFSLQRIRSGWTDEVAAALAEWPGLMRTNAAGLAGGWAGADFDAFLDQADQARTLVQGVLDDIEDAAAELRHREEAIYTLQGGDSGEIPYPAPMVGADGDWTGLVAIHVRPAWWHGDCILMGCDQAEQALRLGGADAGLATEVRAFIEERAGSPTGAAAPSRLTAGEEARTSFGDRIASELAGYTERQAAIDESIAEKRAGQSEQLASMRTDGADRPCPESSDPAYMDLEPPSMAQPAPPAPPVAPQALEDPSPVPPSGDGSVRAEAEGETFTVAAEADPDGPAGGLASGGAGGGFGYGAGPVPAAAVTAGGAGSFTGGAATFAAAAPGMLGGPGAPAPASAAGGSGPAAAVSRGGAAPAQEDRRRHGRSEEDDEAESEEDFAFRETDNVWGYVRPGDDPYA